MWRKRPKEEARKRLANLLEHQRRQIDPTQAEKAEDGATGLRWRGINNLEPPEFDDVDEQQDEVEVGPE